MADFIVKFGSIWMFEKFSGEKCVICNEGIYGDGFRLVLTVYPVEDLTFKETKVICCTSCADAIRKI